jgi:hypothetical protein
MAMKRITDGKAGHGNHPKKAMPNVDEKPGLFSSQALEEKLSRPASSLNPDGLPRSAAGRARGPQAPVEPMADEEIIRLGKRLIDATGMKSSYELRRRDDGLYRRLAKRGLLGQLGFRAQKRGWDSLNDEEIIAQAREYLGRNGICNSSELQKGDRGLYNALMRRGLIQNLGLGILAAAERMKPQP